MIPPTIREALGFGWRAMLRESWLAPLGMLLSIVRSALALAPPAFATAILLKVARLGLRRALPPWAALSDIAAAAAAPRFLAIVAGLWLAGMLLAAALRVAFVAGALPTLGRALAGARGGSPEFAAGVAFRFPTVAGAAVLAWLMDVGAALFTAGSILAALLIALHPGAAPPTLAAALGAGALTGAIFIGASISAVGDATLARAALRGDAPGSAIAAAWARFARRPAAFLVVLAILEAVGLVLAGSTRAFASAATQIAAGADPLLLVGPQLVVSVALALLAAALDLWRLGAVAVLACHAEPGR